MGAPRKRTRDATANPPASVRGHVSEAGRLSLPAELRRAVGLERGGPARIELADGAIRIRTMKEVKTAFAPWPVKPAFLKKRAWPILSAGGRLNAPGEK